MKKFNKIDYIMMTALGMVVLSFLFIVMCFLFNSEREIKIDMSLDAKSQYSFWETKKMEENYKKEMNNFLKNYISLTENEELNAQTVLNLKNNLLEMTVPKDYRDSHLFIFLALENMEKAFQEEDLEKITTEKTTILNEIEQNELLKNIMLSS